MMSYAQSIAQCRNDIRKYNNLKNQINTICSYFFSAQCNCNSINSELNNKYIVDDDSTPIARRVIALKESIDSYYKTLKNNVLPAIDSSINNLYRKIDYLESEEAAAAATLTEKRIK